MPDSKPIVEVKTDRELLLGLHMKLDAMRVSYRRVLRDRLKDRDTIQRHDRRIESLEHQVALLTAIVPGVQTWRPATADLTASEDTVADLAELDLVEDDGDNAP